MAMAMLVVFAAIHVLAVLVVMRLLMVGDRTGMLGWRRDDEPGGGAGGSSGGPATTPKPPASVLARTVPFVPAQHAGRELPARDDDRELASASGSS